MPRSVEYRGPVLKELRGQTHFICEVCYRRMPIKTSLDIHHMHPQMSDSDPSIHSRKFLKLTDNSCHPALHRIAMSLAGSQKDKVPAYELAIQYASSVNLERAQEVASNLLSLAVIVAQAIVAKKNKDIAGGDVTLAIELKPKWNALFKQICKSTRDGNRRSMSKDRMVLLAVMQLIKSRYPELGREIDIEIAQEITHTEPVPQQKNNSITGTSL